MRRVFPLLMVMGLVLAACQPSSSSSPSSSASASEAAASEGPFTAMTYPEAGPQECATEDYNGELSQISATDAHTVVFDLCNPDVGLPVQDRVHRVRASTTRPDLENTHGRPSRSSRQPNGTGPYKLTEWERGDRHHLRAQRRTTGATRR